MDVLELPSQLFPTTEALKIEGPYQNLSLVDGTIEPDTKASLVLPLRITQNGILVRPSRVLISLGDSKMRSGLFLSYPTWGEIIQAIYAIVQIGSAHPNQKYCLSAHMRDIYGHVVSLELNNN